MFQHVAGYVRASALVFGSASACGALSPMLHSARQAASDLEVSGLAGIPPGTVRYVSYDDLLRLPQVTVQVPDDANFAHPVEVQGVSLEQLPKLLGAAVGDGMVVAVCSDQYRSNYTATYVREHHPLLALKINGQAPPGWPKDPHGSGMGPYLITQPAFKPQYHVLSNAEEAHIPWGVVRIDFGNEEKVFAAIKPPSDDPRLLPGYKLASENCYRCHNMGNQGGTKAGHPWVVLAAWATASPVRFENYIRNPQSVDARSNMKGNPSYDAATLDALRRYFASFIVLPPSVARHASVKKEVQP